MLPVHAAHCQLGPQIDKRHLTEVRDLGNIFELLSALDLSKGASYRQHLAHYAHYFRYHPNLDIPSSCTRMLEHACR